MNNACLESGTCRNHEIPDSGQQLLSCKFHCTVCAAKSCHFFSRNSLGTMCPPPVSINVGCQLASKKTVRALKRPPSCPFFFNLFVLSHCQREYCLINRGPGFPAVVRMIWWFGSSSLSPLPSSSLNKLSYFLSLLLSRRSSLPNQKDREKVWSFINHSILSGHSVGCSRGGGGGGGDLTPQ